MTKYVGRLIEDEKRAVTVADGGRPKWDFFPRLNYDCTWYHVPGTYELLRSVLYTINLLQLCCISVALKGVSWLAISDPLVITWSLIGRYHELQRCQLPDN